VREIVDHRFTLGAVTKLLIDDFARLARGDGATARATA
jgi:hypothetical protein